MAGFVKNCVLRAPGWPMVRTHAHPLGSNARTQKTGDWQLQHDEDDDRHPAFDQRDMSHRVSVSSTIEGARPHTRA